MDPGSSTQERRPLIIRGGTLALPDNATLNVEALRGEGISAGARSVRVGNEPIVIGRDPSCAIILDDRQVSAVHCELRAERRGVLVRDLRSRNGTFIGPAGIVEALLVNACAIQVGGTSLTFTPHNREHVAVDDVTSFGKLVGGSPRMRQLFRTLREVAPSELSVLVTGESGTGKELVAEAIHEHSDRRKGPFAVLDCGAISPSLAESLLFGHEKGAFTDAHERRDGVFQEAHKGTLFLDELGELPIDLQPKLLRALAERKVKRVGGKAYEPVDIRLVAATRRDLWTDMNAGRFRSDLFFRIAQIRIELSPLRERIEDVPLVVEELSKRLGKPERAADAVRAVKETFGSYDWPGNVRELASAVAVIVGLPPGSDLIDALHPRAEVRNIAPPTSAFSEAKRKVVSDFERSYFTSLGLAANWNVSEMARRSGMERHHVRAFLKRHGLSSKDSPSSRGGGKPDKDK